ncbi:MAG: TonB family protein, partial [Paracoccus sp. (in: a-proteobacteria)]|nr:TonB family protein [Paracoccus sp. (in: a-proteobacteria)]
RPDRPRPQQVQRQHTEQPRRERAAQPQPQRQQAAPQRAGQGGSARQMASGGSGGISEGRRRDLMGQWGGQIRACISRRASPPRGIRSSGRVTLALTVSRDGTIRAVSVAGSSGHPSLDQAALAAAQRAGRCPAAPAGLDNASYSFQLPIQLNVR